MKYRMERKEIVIDFLHQAVCRINPTAQCLLMLCVCWCIIFWCPSTTAAEAIARQRGTVVSVIDGDSLKLKSRGKIMEVRLWGIDAPEWDQPHAYHAKTMLQHLLLEKEVVFESYTVDKYNRIIAQIFLDNHSINRLLVEHGYAWVHVYYCRREICDEWKELESAARNRKAGLWRDTEAIPPWKWKNKKRR